jgi:hypothetical protein
MKNGTYLSRWTQWCNVVWCGVALLGVPGACAAGQGVPGLLLTNQTLLSDGRGFFEVLVPSNGIYTLEISTDLKKWDHAFTLEATGPRLPITSPEPLTTMPQLFVRVRVGIGVYTDLALHFYASPGAFGLGSTPPVAFPVGLNDYTAHFTVEYDEGYPEGTNVFFTGPAGSGLTQTMSDKFGINTNENSAWYGSPRVSSPVEPPAGGWMVSYKGTNLTFTLPAAQTSTHLVIPVPTVTVVEGLLQQVAWVYRNPVTGAGIVGDPPHATLVQLQIDRNTGPGQGDRIYQSDWLIPATTSHVLSAPVTWSEVTMLHLAYDDDLNNHYVISYQR